MANFGMPKMELGNLYIYKLLGFPSMFGRDPFANDPFFADSGFGNVDKMMSQMQKQMRKAMEEPRR